MSYNELSKFLVIEGPLQLLPHNCSGCGRYQEEDGSELKFIDWNCDIEFYGKVYICQSCVREMAEQFGMVDEHSVSLLTNQMHQDEIQITELKTELEKYKNAMAALDSIGISMPDFSRSSIVVAAAAENGELPHSEPVRESEDSEHESNGQDSESGSSDVHGNESSESDDSLDEFFSELDI